MLVRENKISRGLSNLLSRKQVSHFETSPELFIENPRAVNAYFNSFSEAQLAEIASH